MISSEGEQWGRYNLSRPIQVSGSTMAHNPDGMWEVVPEKNGSDCWAAVNIVK